MDISRLSLIGIFILISDLLFNVYHKPFSLGYYDITAIAFGSICILFGVAYEKIHILFRKICEISDSNPYSILCIILIISLLIRILLLLPERWINPDEGAHLYDGKLILEGKVPFIDYISRMPVYAYTLAAFLKMFGCNYISGRLLPLFCNIGISILIFLIGKRLFESNKIALLASTIYLFSPLTILWSVVVKTEPLETLFICTGMFLLLSFIKSEQEKFSLIYFSGFLFALAYYVRRSAIVILAASLLFIIYFYKDELYKVIRTYGILLLGYFSVVVLIFIFFSSFNGFTATWESTLNPLDTILNPIQKITVASSETIVSSSTESTTQPFAQILLDWKWILKFNLFLLFGLAMFILTVVILYIKKEPNTISEKNKTSIIFLCIWAISIVTFLIYYSITGSFYTPYFGEIVPVLVLLFAYGMIFIASKEKLNTIPLKNIKIAVILIITALYISSISLINTSFECVWSPDTVEEISNYIKINSDEGDEIMSGGMVWTLDTDTMIFMNISHPLCYYYIISEDQKKKMKNEMENNKPEFIIFDGYTEKIYFKHIPEMYCILNESYIMKKEVNGSNYPVIIYELNTSVSG